jgi:hypothetical protein
MEKKIQGTIGVILRTVLRTLQHEQNEVHHEKSIFCCNGFGGKLFSVRM